MTNNSTEFKNDSVEINVSKLPGCIVKFDIFVTPKATHAAHEKAVKTVNKEVSLPGFRKGKAPTSLVTQNFKKHIDQEWRDILVNTAFKEALELSNIYPFNDKSIKQPNLKQISLEDGSKLTIEIEAAPEIPTINISELKLHPKDRVEVTDTDVDNTIHNIRMHHAQWEEKNDRPVEEGDFVDVDIVTADEEQKEICKDMRIEVADGKMGEWMKKLLIGSKTNDVVEGLSEKQEHSRENCNACKDGDENHHHEMQEEEEPFKPTLCRITIKSIKVPNLPEMDDALAEKTGLKTFEELKTRINKDLNIKADQNVHADLRKQIEDQLLQKYPFDIPISVTKAEKNHRLDQIMQDYQKDGSLEEFNNQKKAIENQVMVDLDHAFRMYFLARKIAEENNITVTQEELYQEMIKQIYMPENEQKLIDPEMPPEEIRSRLYVTILSHKVKDFLVEQAQKQA